uniref:galactose-3-O-sulfotransferase 2-like isoform X2 n=1 Tax=Myxine glutinosa TaxID=7769 RepID=UPI00358E03F1
MDRSSFAGKHHPLMDLWVNVAPMPYSCVFLTSTGQPHAAMRICRHHCLIVVTFGATILTFLAIYHDLTSEQVVGLQHIAAGFVSSILGNESQGKVGTIDTTSLRGHGTDHLLLQSKSTAGQKSTEVRPEECKPRHHIMFLKTHKTAGSTVLNILYRYGDYWNLSFALPVHYQFGYPSLFRAMWVKGHDAGQRFDLMCNHMRFRLSEVKKVMHPDTFYFTILRHPVEVAASSFSYYKSTASAFRNISSLDSFMQNPLRFFRPGAQGNNYARNLMWFDLGLDPQKNHTQTELQKIFSSLDDTFGIVLLADYFDESMVLLQHALCWSLDDVVTFKLNSRSNATIKAISQETAVRLRQWNSLDWALYSHFNTSFWHRAVHFGLARLDAEVQELRARRNVLATLCLQGSAVEGKTISDKRFKPFQFGLVQILGYQLKPGLSREEFTHCSRFIVPELQYKDRIYLRQFPSKIQVRIKWKRTTGSPLRRPLVGKPT